MFRSTPPHGGDRNTPISTFGHEVFRSTPPHGGDGSDGRDFRQAEVSIHAPAWGRRRHLCQRGQLDHVSIHAPAWGRPRLAGQRFRHIDVSIHAPAWGRPAAAAQGGAGPMFRSTPPHGGDRGWAPFHVVIDVSIHAPAWGRPIDPGMPPAANPFRSTPPHGGDIPCGAISRGDRVSIHAPAWGRRPISNIRALRGKCCCPRDPTGGARLRPMGEGVCLNEVGSFESFGGCANRPGGVCALEVRAGGQNTRGPSRSWAGLAPMCSTRRRPSAPSR